MKKLDNLMFYGLLAGAGVAVVYLMVRGVGGTAKDITKGVISGAVDAAAGILQGAYEAVPDSVKPTNDNNVIYQGANAVVHQLPGADSSDTLGTWLYNITHPNEKF